MYFNYLIIHDKNDFHPGLACQKGSLIATLNFKPQEQLSYRFNIYPGQTTGLYEQPHSVST